MCVCVSVTAALNRPNRTKIDNGTDTHDNNNNKKITTFSHNQCQQLTESIESIQRSINLLMLWLFYTCKKRTHAHTPKNELRSNYGHRTIPSLPSHSHSCTHNSESLSSSTKFSRNRFQLFTGLIYILIFWLYFVCVSLTGHNLLLLCRRSEIVTIFTTPHTFIK